MGEHQHDQQHHPTVDTREARQNHYRQVYHASEPPARTRSTTAPAHEACEHNPRNAARGVPQPAHEARKENGMRNWNVSENRITRRSLLAACSTALAVGLTVSLPLPAHAGHVTPPPVPAALKVEQGNRAFLEGHAGGTQNYICLPCPNPTTAAAQCPDASGFAWLLFTPEATLFNDHDKQLTTHFFSPNPAENGTIRATWQNSRDSSIVWGGQAIASRDPNFVAPDAIAWLLLPMAGVQDGPNGGDTLTA